VATAKKTTRTKVGGTSKLKSNSNNKLIIVIVVLIIALVGGFFVYRSFAASKRRVLTAADSELSVNPVDAVSARRMKDGAATVWSFYGKKEFASSRDGLNYSGGRNAWEAIEISTNGAKVVPGDIICVYAAVLDISGQAVDADQINSNDPGTQTHIGSYGLTYAKPTNSGTNALRGGQGYTLSSHLIGGKTSFAGVGAYRKYCFEQGNFTTDKLNFSIATHIGLNSIFQKSYEIRLLKVVIGDTLADAPYSKNPYQ